MGVAAPKGVHIFTGTDSYAAFQASKAFVAQQAVQHQLEIEAYDGDGESGEEALEQLKAVWEALVTVPLFGKGRIVWWKHVDLLGASVFFRNPALLRVWQNLLEVLSQGTTPYFRLVIHARALDRRIAALKDLLANAMITRCDRVSPGSEEESDEIAQLEEQLQKLGWEPEPGVSEWLFWATGGDRGLLEQELAKLAVYPSGDRRLTRTFAATLVPVSRGGDLWGYCDAVLAGKLDEAWDSLQRLLALGESEIGLASLLAAQIRLAARTACLREAGLLRLVRRGSTVLAEVDPPARALLVRSKSGELPSPWRLGRIATRSQRLPIQRWVRAVERVEWLLRELVTQDLPRVLLERATLELCQILS